MKRVMFALLLAMTIAPSAWAQSWPNEPSGATVINDWSWNSCPGGGWYPAYGCGQIVTDSTAPQSPSNVLRFSYNPSNGTGGGDPYVMLGDVNEVFIGFWLKLSNPFMGCSNLANKIAVMNTQDGSWIWFKAEGQQNGPLHAVVGFQVTNGNLSNCHNSGYGDCPGIFTFTPNVGSGNIPKGQWVRIEIHYKRSSSTTSRDGIVRLWVNGQPAISSTTANWSNAPFSTLYFTPTWDGGGVGCNSTNPDTESFDHVHISVPSGSGSTPKGDTTPPASPAGLRAN